MAFNINEFTSNMRNGGARPNLFRLRIGSIPSVVQVRTGSQDFQYFCKSVSGIPASTLGVIEVPYFGRTVKFAGDREFAELTTTIINEENMQIRNIMDSWINGLNETRNNTASEVLRGRTSFTSELTLETFKKQGDIDQTWKFRNCWPSNISSIDVNWDSQNAIQEFTVTWQYDTYEHQKAF